MPTLSRTLLLTGLTLPLCALLSGCLWIDLPRNVSVGRPVVAPANASRYERFDPFPQPDLGPDMGHRPLGFTEPRERARRTQENAPIFGASRAPRPPVAPAPYGTPYPQPYPPAQGFVPQAAPVGYTVPQPYGTPQPMVAPVSYSAPIVYPAPPPVPMRPW